MRRVLFATAALAALGIGVPVAARAQSAEQALVDRATLSVQEMMAINHGGNLGRFAAAGTRGDDLPAGVPRRLHPRRRGRRLRAARPRRRRLLVGPGLLRPRFRQHRLPGRHPGRRGDHGHPDQSRAERHPRQPVQGGGGRLDHAADGRRRHRGRDHGRRGGGHRRLLAEPRAVRRRSRSRAACSTTAPPGTRPITASRWLRARS